MKINLILCLLILAAFTTLSHAQAISIIGYEITTDNGCRITLSLEGEVDRIALPAGNITRDPIRQTITSIGDVPIVRDPIRQTITSIGDVLIVRDPIRQTITGIGDARIVRDPIRNIITSISGDKRVQPVVKLED